MAYRQFFTLGVLTIIKQLCAVCYVLYPSRLHQWRRQNTADGRAQHGHISLRLQVASYAPVGHVQPLVARVRTPVCHSLAMPLSFT